MRKVEESAQPIDLERKIKVEVSLAELLAIKAALGLVNEHDVNDNISLHYPSISTSYIESETTSLSLFQDTIKLLENEGISEGDK